MGDLRRILCTALDPGQGQKFCNSLACQDLQKSCVGGAPQSTRPSRTSRRNVTGPSFTRSTSMRAPKRPVATARPCSASRSARPRGRAPRRAPDPRPGRSPGRFPFVRLPASVNWLTTRQAPPTSCSVRSIGVRPGKILSAATLRAVAAASASSSPCLDAHEQEDASADPADDLAVDAYLGPATRVAGGSSRRLSGVSSAGVGSVSYAAHGTTRSRAPSTRASSPSSTTCCTAARRRPRRTSGWPASKGRPLLELGCGTGRLLLLRSRAPTSETCGDSTCYPDMLDALREKLAREAPRCARASRWSRATRGSSIWAGRSPSSRHRATSSTTSSGPTTWPGPSGVGPAPDGGRPVRRRLQRTRPARDGRGPRAGAGRRVHAPGHGPPPRQPLHAALRLRAPGRDRRDRGRGDSTATPCSGARGRP